MASDQSSARQREFVKPNASNVFGAVVGERLKLALWLGWTALLTGLFVGLAGLHLDRYPPLSGDDSWIMSASYKWAFTGVFGSDLYTGFFNADRHYFIALPVYQFLQAAVCRLFGAGIVQARSVSLASGVVVLWAVSWLAYRWYGLAVAALTAALLLLWPANLLVMRSGLPLVTVSQMGRYDATALAFIWLALVLFDQLLRRPSLVTATALGICAGLATLTQFFGGFVVPVVALVCWRARWAGGERTVAKRLAAGIAGGFLLVVLPYAGYVARYPSDFRGQATLKAGRTGFFALSFYLANVRHEPDRYARVLRQAVALTGRGASMDIALSMWLLLVGLPAGLAFLILRVRRAGRPSDRIALTSLLVFLAGLALFDSTKASLYAVVLWPSLCMAVALAAVTAVRASWRRPELGWRCAALLLVALFGLVLTAGARALETERALAARTTPYDVVARRIDAELDSPGTIVGPERWWWGFHDRSYLALNNLEGQWVRDRAAGERVDFATLLASVGGRTIVVDDHVRGDLGRYPAPLAEEIRAFLLEDARLIATVTDPTYGEIELYQVLKPDADTGPNRGLRADGMPSAR